MISRAAWRKYIDKLAEIDRKAADQMQAWVDINGLTDDKALIQYAYGLATKYGEASATLSSEMYDTMSGMMQAGVPEAVPAETATYEEIAKGMMYGKYHSPSKIPSIVGRHVRQAGADTMIQNAKRDHAEWAWVPQGDTCPFCIMLASEGWHKASSTALIGGHAEHIHQNCDCTFAISFSEKDKKQYNAVYNQKKYKDMYDAADGDTPNERMNYIRRQIYDRNKDEINAQKREAYQNKLLEEAFNSLKSHDITRDFVHASTPGVGIINYADGFQDKQGEEAASKWIFDTFGGNITLLAENNPEGEANPDYLWNGKYWDLKSPQTSKERTIEDRIRTGIRQIAKNPGGVLLDFSKSDLSFAEVIKKVDYYGNKRAKETTTFIVKKDNDFVVLIVTK